VTGPQLVQYVLSGLGVGSVYATVALGFNIIYNATGIINFAQGEFLVVGAMTAISLTAFLPLPLAIAGAVLVTTALGALLEIAFVRSLRSPTVLRVIVITIGASILIREAMLHIWDEKVRALPHFTGTEISSIEILGARVSPQVLWILGTSVAIMAGLTAFFRFTLTGRAMRACADNRDAARLCGIKSRAMVTLSFMLSAGIGALAGCALSPHTQTQYDMGAALAVKGFAVAILGGLGNSVAAVAAGLILGVFEALSITVAPLAFKDVVAVATLMIVLVVRPSGLFGSRTAASLRDT
jgi:branched-chain amino acid transport system permease protein